MPTLVDVDTGEIASPNEAQLGRLLHNLGGTTRPPFQNVANIAITNPNRRQSESDSNFSWKNHWNNYWNNHWNNYWRNYWHDYWKKKMGCRSQNQNGSIQKCKKRGTKMKRYRRGEGYRVSVNSRMHFIPSVHCLLCKKRAVSKELAAKYKKGHHERCPKKKENVQKYQERQGRFAWHQAAQPQASAATAAAASDVTTTLAYTRESEVRMGNLNGVPNWMLDKVKTADELDNDDESHDASDFVQDMRHCVDKAMSTANDKDSSLNFAFSCKAPPVLVIAMNNIIEQFGHRRPPSASATLPMTPDFVKKIERYYEIFPQGSCQFEFPKDLNKDPSPTYHQLEGEKIIYLDWNLCHPDVILPCPVCAYNVRNGSAASHSDSFLVHTRCNFRKNQGSLFPIWNFDGSIVWCAVMVYQCQYCKENVSANDGHLLNMLPPHVSATYPVLPKYACGGFHLHKDTSRFLELMMKTYGNGDMVSNLLQQSVGIHYTQKAVSYLSKRPSRPFMKLEEFTNGNWPPSGATLRRLFESAEYSPLNIYGYSNFERYTRECQNVTVVATESIATDHTFQVTNAYGNKEGMKAMFTCIKAPSKEMVAIVGVPSTKLQDAAHCLKQSCIKRGMKPSVISTDTMPHGEEFWKELYGEDIHCQLGLFHLLTRIYATLDRRSNLFGECLLALKECIYRYDPADWKNLEEALKAGTLSNEGKEYTDADIHEMQRTKVFSRRYSKYLKKEFHSEVQIRSNLAAWIENWDHEEDDFHRPVFTYKTADATTNQFDKISYVLDCMRAETYTTIPAPPGSKHGLPTFKSNRPESMLEKFHELLGHYCNVGCGDEFANAIIMKGWAEYNVAARHRYYCTRKRSANQLEQLRALDITPTFLDHSLLHCINELSRDLGHGDLFGNYEKPPNKNNGEVFLKTYFDQQVERNKKELFDKKSKQCTCNECKIPAGLPTEIPAVPAAGVEGNDSRLLTCQLTTQMDSMALDGTSTSSVASETREPQGPETIQEDPPGRHHTYGYCYPFPPYRCDYFQNYVKRKQARKQAGESVVRGRPPHSYNCPTKSMLKGWAPVD